MFSIYMQGIKSSSALITRYIGCRTEIAQPPDETTTTVREFEMLEWFI